MLGNNIKDLRIEKGLTQEQLAKEIGVTQGAIYFWEKEINEPTAGYLIKLASFFEVSVDEILSFEVKKEEAISKSAEMTMLFDKLSERQQNLVISIAKELVKI